MMLTQPMYPQEALRNLTYSSPIYVDIEVEIILNPMTDERTVLCKKRIDSHKYWKSSDYGSV